MTALDRNPTSANFLSPNNFRLQVSKLPNTTFFVQRINIPGLSLPEVPVPTPLTALHLSGDHIQWGDLRFVFKVDENLNNWREIFNWLTGAGFPESTDQFEEIKSETRPGYGLFSDITLFVLNSARNPSLAINFKQCQPTTLSDIDFDSTSTNIDFITASAIFKYTSYTFESIS